MGKLDDWCTCKGLETRRKGMAKKESKRRKIFLACLYGLSALICFAVGGFQLGRYSNAVKINEDYGANAYNTCKVPSFSFDPGVSESEKSSITSNIVPFCDNAED